MRRPALSILGVLAAAAMGWSQETAGVSPTTTAATSRSAVAMGPLLDLSFAGLSAAVPVGFEITPPSHQFMVLQAGRPSGDDVVMAVTIWCQPEPAATTLEAFIKAANPARDLNIRQLRELKNVPWPVVNLQARLIVQEYTYRGVPTVAMRLFFLRPVPDSPLQMAYVVTVEADRDKARGQVVGAFSGVADSIRLVELTSPSRQPVPPLGEPVVSRGQGYSIRPPKFWKVQAGPQMALLAMAQTDYVQGTIMPRLHLRVSAAPEAVTQTCAEAAAKTVLDDIAAAKHQGKVVQKGPVPVAGREGYEFLIEESWTTEDGTAGKVAIAQKTVCAFGKTYDLRLVGDAADPVGILEKLNVIAAGLTLQAPEAPASGPATEPATEPAATSGVPASGPASAPASAQTAPAPAGGAETN